MEKYITRVVAAVASGATTLVLFSGVVSLADDDKARMVAAASSRQPLQRRALVPLDGNRGHVDAGDQTECQRKRIEQPAGD